MSLEWAIGVALFITAMSLMTTEVLIPVLEQIRELHEHIHADHAATAGHTH